MLLSILVALLVVAVLVGFNALYVAGEFAAVSARKTRVVRAADEGDRFARMLLPVLNDPHRLDNYIAASQVGITISSIVLGIYGQQQIAPLIASWGLGGAGGEVAAAGIAATLVLVLLTTLQVIFGELLPKSIALQYPERVALATAVPMKWSADYILKPLIVLLNGSGRLILRLMGVETTGGHAHIHSPEEIVLLLSESHKSGLIDADERQMLRNVFRVSETTAIEIAVPRTRIVAAEVSEPVATVLRRAAESAFSRIPVYEQDLDHIVGFVHLRDLFNVYRRDEAASLRDILRPVPFVPETQHLIDVWNTLTEENSYLAIVFDEYGGTSGIITREDLVEELFGEMLDEFDQERELFQLVGERRYLVRGDMHVERLNELLGIALPHRSSHTVGGLVLNQLGRAPKTGDTVEINNVEMVVESLAGKSVSGVQVTVLGSQDEQNAGESA